MKTTRMAVAGVALAVSILAAATGYGIAQIGGEQRFDDVAPSHYAFEAASWAADLGITAGCGDARNFCPDRMLTRGEMVTFLYRYHRSARDASEDPPPPATSVAASTATDFYTLWAAGNRHPEGIWSDGTTMWVADSDDHKIYAYDLATKARDPSQDLPVLGRGSGVDYAPSLTPEGIWSDGTTMWVAITGLGDKINAYNLATKALDESKSFTLLRTGNRHPQGIWSDGTTMWVADSDDHKIYAYDLATKARDPSQDLILRGERSILGPTDIWSDGRTMWVAGVASRSLLAYDLFTKARVPSEDFTEPWSSSDANKLHHAAGLWSDGRTMWVASWLSEEIHAFDMTTKRYVGDGN